MNNQINIVFTLIITFVVLVSIAVKFYLFCARRVEKETKKLIWAAAKAVFSVAIMIFMFVTTINKWFKKPDSIVDFYMYFLTFIYSLMGTIENYGAYKKEEERQKTSNYK